LAFLPVFFVNNLEIVTVHFCINASDRLSSALPLSFWLGGALRGNGAAAPEFSGVQLTKSYFGH